MYEKVIENRLQSASQKRMLRVSNNAQKMKFSIKDFFS